MRIPLLQRLNLLKVRHKFVLAILLNIVLVLACFVLIIQNFQEKRLFHNVEEKNLSLAKNMAGDSVEGLLVRNFQQLDVLVNSAQEAIWAKYAMILDGQGKIVVHTNKGRLGEKISFPDSEGLRTLEIVDKGQLLKEYWVPVKVRDELLGYGILGIDHSKEVSMINADLRNLRYRLILVSCFLFLVATVTSYLVAGVLTKRFSLLKSRMLEVQQNNLQVELPELPQIVCSDFLNCKHTQCPAYGKTKCWTISNRFLEGYKDCSSCAVYKQCTGDEIGELNQAFNQMVSELRENLAKLEEANLEKNRLERLSLLGQMSAQVAHEIKNPLNSIKGSAHYLKKNFQGELLQEFLQIIEEESERLSDIVSDFLNFSKPGPAVLALSDFNQMIRDTLQLMESEFKEREIELVLDLDKSIPNFRFDYAKLKQSLLNLLVNAFQAIEGKGRIQVQSRLGKDDVQLIVQDNGVGISEEEQENLFKPFYTTKVRGSGLGLAIVEQNIKEHQGSIELKSELKKGTSFSINLPIG